jgi:hypothetical protein
MGAVFIVITIAIPTTTITNAIVIVIHFPFPVHQSPPENEGRSRRPKGSYQQLIGK